MADFYNMDFEKLELRVMAQMIGLRPEVFAFAKLMEEKLRKHDDERGQSWKHDNTAGLYERLEEECNEVWHALNYWRKMPLDQERGKRAALECADVANFAMMIADVVGGLKEG